MATKEEAMQELARREIARRQAITQTGSSELAPQLNELSQLTQNPNAYQGAVEDFNNSPWYSQAGQALDDIARLGASGLSFGFADKLAGSLTGTGTEEQRRLTDEARARSGWAGTAAEVGGSVAVPVGAGQAGVTLMGKFGSPAWSGIGGMLGRTGLAAAEGAGYGTLDALGNDRNPLSGALFGASFGAGANALGEGAGKAYNAVMNSSARKEVARNAGINPDIAELLLNASKADDAFGPSGAANMARSGNEAMLADAGLSTRNMLDTAIQRGGEGANLARGRIDERLARGANDLNSALDQTLGGVGGYSRSPSASKEMSELYSKAYNSPIDYSAPAAREIESIISNRVPKSAIDAANALMRVEGVTSKQILANVADDGSVIFQSMPDVRQLDYITRGLNQVADAANAQGALGGTTPIGRAYGNLSKEIRTNLKGLVPEYGAALDKAGTEIGKVNASRFGESLLSDKTTRSEVSEFVSGLPKAEIDALKLSVRQNIDDSMSRVKAAFTDPNIDARQAASALKTLSSKSNKEKLSSVLGEDATNKLMGEVDRITQSFGLKASVADNSKTYARQAVDRSIGEMTSAGPLDTLASGKPLNAAQVLIQGITGQTPARLAERQGGIYSEIADILTRPSNQSIPTLQAVQNYGGQMSTNKSVADEIAALLTQGRYGAGAFASQMQSNGN